MSSRCRDPSRRRIHRRGTTLDRSRSPPQTPTATPVERNGEEPRRAIDERGHCYRLAVGRPRRRALQLQRTGDDARVGAVGVHDVQRRAAVSRAEKLIRRPSRAMDGAPMIRVARRAPQFGGGAPLQLPDGVAFTLRRDIQQIVGAEPRRGAAAGGQRDARAGGRLTGCRRAESARTCSSSARGRHEAPAAGACGQRRVPFETELTRRGWRWSRFRL